MCAQIAGIQDFRQEGPPGDIGTFQIPCSSIVFQFTFSGTTYIVAMRSGVGGWVLISQGTVAATVINAAINASPNGAKITMKAGSYSITLSIVNKPYVELWGEGYGTRFELDANVDMFTSLDQGNGHMGLYYITLDGNGRNQKGVYWRGQVYSHIEYCKFFDFINNYLEFADATAPPENFWGTIKNNYFEAGHAGNANTAAIKIREDCEVSGNIIARQPAPALIPRGIWLTGAGNRVTGNHMTENDYGIRNDGGNNIIMDNVFDTMLNVALYLVSSRNVVVGNRFSTCSSGLNVIYTDDYYNIIMDNGFSGGNPNRCVYLDADSYGNRVIGNTFLNMVSAAVLDDGVGLTNWVAENAGYNPVGNIANPYSVAAGFLGDVAAAQAFPTTHTDYTVKTSPKFITIYAGTVTAILIGGVATGLTSGGFYLSPGQVLHVDWTGQPSSKVYAI